MSVLTVVAAVTLFGSTRLQSAVELRRLQRTRQEQTTTVPSHVRLGKEVKMLLVSPRRARVAATAKVTGVVDGSVITVNLKGNITETVRLLGANAPLLLTGSTEEQCFAEDAKTKLSNFLLGKEITLEKDPSYASDNEGRLLRYVRLGTMDINGWVVWNGYAYADRNNDYARKEDYVSREDEAKDSERGLWSAVCDYHPNPKHRIRVIE